MNYVLKLDLVGADSVKGALAGLKSLQSSVTSGGGVFSTGSNSPSAKILSDLDKASHRVAGMKKDFQSIATSMAQGSGNGRAWIATAFASKSAQFQALNPHLAGIMRGLVSESLPWKQYGMANRFGTGLMGWATPAIQMMAFRKLGTIRGLRDVGGADLAKIAAMGAFSQGSITGLRDITGADLAKVAALGSFDQAISASSIASQGVPPKLRAASGAGPITTLVMRFVTVASALEAFRKALQFTTDAVNKGYGIYTQSASSGVTPGLYSYRSSLANIFGAQGNPNQVFMFGNAVKQVSDRIAESTRTLAQNSPTLAQVAINSKILKLDFDALASDMITKLAPALNIIIAGFDNLTKGFDKFLDTKLGKLLIGGMTIWAAGSFLPFGSSQSAKDFSKPLPSMLPILMKQLPASSWEHMGLSVGPNLGNEIVNQIKLSNSFLKHLPMIAAAVGANNGVPRGGTFALNPMVNNP